MHDLLKQKVILLMKHRNYIRTDGIHQKRQRSRLVVAEMLCRSVLLRCRVGWNAFQGIRFQTGDRACTGSNAYPVVHLGTSQRDVVPLENIENLHVNYVMQTQHSNAGYKLTEEGLSFWPPKQWSGQVPE